MYDPIYKEMSRIGKSIEMESRSMVSRGGGEEVGSDCLLCMGSFGGDRNVLKLDSGKRCITL